MEKAPTLKELLNNRKENHANLIIVSTNKIKTYLKVIYLNYRKSY